MFHIAICDDEPAICSQIERIVMDFGRKISFGIEVDVYFSGEELYQYLEEGTYYDMIFLDIELKELDGIDVGRKIRNDLKNETVLIVYISGRDSYAMELFEIRPMHFLVKPIRREKIMTVLEKGMNLSNLLSKTFKYKQGHQNKKIEAKNIVYFESMERKVKLFTLEGEEIFYGSLGAIFPDVERFGFFFCHRSYLVNYHHIANFKYEKLIMKNGMTLPISRTKRIGVREMQIRFEMKEV